MSVSIHGLDLDLGILPEAEGGSDKSNVPTVPWDFSARLQSLHCKTVEVAETLYICINRM